MCPYCGGHGFSADDTYTPDKLEVGAKPDTVRWLNKCSNPDCLKWSVWSPDDTQKALPDPANSKSLK